MQARGPAHRIFLGAVLVSALAAACSGGQPTAKTAEPPPKAVVEAPARTIEAALPLRLRRAPRPRGASNWSPARWPPTSKPSASISPIPANW